MTNKLRHQLLGIFALFFLGVYLCIICTGHAILWQGLRDSSLRLSVLFGVIWLAWEDLLCLPRWLYIFAPIIILAVMVFPRIAPIVIIILIPTWLLLKFLRFLSQPLPPQQGGPKAK